MFFHSDTTINLEIQIDVFMFIFIVDIYCFIIIVYFNNFCIYTQVNNSIVFIIAEEDN